MEIVILPPNTSPNVIRNSHTLMDTTANRQDFQKKVYEIMSIPNKTQNTVKNSTDRKSNDHNRQSEKNNIQRMLEIANKVAKFTKEAEKLITILCVLQKRRGQDSKILQQKYCKRTKDKKTETDYFSVAEFLRDPHSAPWSTNAL